MRLGLHATCKPFARAPQVCTSLLLGQRTSEDGNNIASSLFRERRPEPPVLQVPLDGAWACWRMNYVTGTWYTVCDKSTTKPPASADAADAALDAFAHVLHRHAHVARAHARCSCACCTRHVAPALAVATVTARAFERR